MIPVLAHYSTPTLSELLQVVTDIQAWARNAVRVNTSSVDHWVDKGIQFVSVSLVASERNQGVAQRLQEVLEEKQAIMKKWWGPAAPVKLYSTPGDGDLVVYLTTPVDTLTKQPAPAPNTMVVLDEALKQLQSGLQPVVAFASSQGSAVVRTADTFTRVFHLDKLNPKRAGFKAFVDVRLKTARLLKAKGSWKDARTATGSILEWTWTKTAPTSESSFTAKVVLRDDPALGAIRLTLEVSTA